MYVVYPRFVFVMKVYKSECDYGEVYRRGMLRVGNVEMLETLVVFSYIQHIQLHVNEIQILQPPILCLQRLIMWGFEASTLTKRRRTRY